MTIHVAVQGSGRFSRNPRFQPKTAFSPFPPVQSAVLNACFGSTAVRRQANSDRLIRAVSAPTRITSGRIGASTITVIPLHSAPHLADRPDCSAPSSSLAMQTKNYDSHRPQ